MQFSSCLEQFKCLELLARHGKQDKYEMRQVGELMLILFPTDLADADLVPETTSNASRPVPRYVTWFQATKSHNGYIGTQSG